MSANRDYDRFRVGHINLPRKETSSFDVDAAGIFVAGLWPDVAKQTEQAMHNGRPEADLRCSPTRLFVKQRL